MTYLKRTNYHEKRDRTTRLIIAAVLVFLFALHYVFPGLYPTIFYPITNIFWKSENAVAVFLRGVVTTIESKQRLALENEELKQQITRNKVRTLLIDTLASENESLKLMLGRSVKEDAVVGTIVSRPPTSPYDTLIIDIGLNVGIKTGDKVYVGDSMIGDVAEVYESTSKVSLFSTPGRITPVLVGSSTLATEAVGRGGGNFMIKLPSQVEVSVGSLIMMPHIKTRIFSIVDKILVNSSDSLQTILSKSPVHIQQIRFVEVDREIPEKIIKKTIQKK